MTHFIFNRGTVLALIIALLAWAAVANVDVQGYRSKSTDYIEANL